jgi:type I restriction enzyme S subunit
VSEAVATPARSRSDWKWVTLADVGKVITGNTPPTADAENYGDAVPFVKPTELVDRGIRSAPNGLAPQAMGKARVVPAGAVLVSCIGNLGKTGIAKVPVAFNQQINAVVFNENVIPEFGFYYVQTLKPWLYGESSATTIPIVNKGKFQQARFPLPPLDEQREIVAELEKQFSRLDEAVANLQRVKANLKRYKASVLKAAVEGRLVETEAYLARREGRTYETGEQLLQRILEERRAKWAGKGKYKEPDLPVLDGLNPLSEGWAYATTEQMCEQIASGSTPSPEAMFSGDGEVPFLKVYNLTFDGSLDFTVKPTFVSNSTHQGMLARSRSVPGDVLMNIVGPPLGKVSIVPPAYPEWNINQAIVTFRTSSGLVNQLLAHWLLARPVLSRLERTAKATAGQHNLQVSTCRKLPIPVPPLAEQKRIVAEVDRHLSIIREVEAEIDANLERAQALRQATLAKAFSAS